MMRKSTPTVAAPPAPTPLPVPTDPTVREAQRQAETEARKRKGRASTLMSGVMSDAAPPKVQQTLLGGV